MKTFKKKILLGKIDYHDRGRKINSVEIEVEIKNKPNAIDWETLKEIHDVPELTMSGGIWDGRHYDIVSGGQMLDEIVEYFPSNSKLKRLVEIWEEYHLNDLKAGTKKQTAALEGLKYERGDWYDAAVKHLKSAKLYDDNGYQFGSAWLYQPLPEKIIDEVEKLCDELNASVKTKKLKAGGVIENQYEGMTPAEVYNAWGYEQRKHFFLDHCEETYGISINNWSLGDSLKNQETAKLNFNDLNQAQQMAIKDHVEMGEYGGGGVLPITHESHFGNHLFKQIFGV